MKIKNVIFDVDGTLLDATEGIIESVLYAENKLKLKHLTYVELLHFIGPPIQESFSKYYGCNDKSAQEAANIYRDYYKHTALYKAKLYDGVLEMCQALCETGFHIGIATLKREDYALQILRHFGFDKYCCSIHGADNDNKMTKAEIIQMCIKDMGGEKNSFVLVGDTVYDAIGAQQAGISFLGVTYGFGFKRGDTISPQNIGYANSAVEVVNLLKVLNAS